MDDLTFSIQVSPALGRGELILAIVPFHIQLVEVSLLFAIVNSQPVEADGDHAESSKAAFVSARLGGGAA